MSKRSLVAAGGHTVHESKALKIRDLVDAGVSADVAAEQVGTTINALRNKGAMTALVRNLLANIADADLLNEANQRAFARARLVEIAAQDEDLKSAVSALRALSGADQPITAVQVNNLPTDPAILEALRSLNLLIEDKKENENGINDGDVPAGDTA